MVLEHGIILRIDRTEIDRFLSGLFSRIRDPKPALSDIGDLVEESIRRNFRMGGRPGKWRQSGRAGGQRGQTLRDTNRLMNSFTSKVESGRVVVGTNVAYAPTHQFGAKKGSFGTVVARVKAHACSPHPWG